MECEGPECSCCDNYPLQLLAWVLAFITWYQIYNIFIAFVSHYSLLFNIFILVVFNIIWILTMTSLFWAALMSTAPMPSRFDAPLELCALKRNDDFFRLLADYGANHPNLDCQYTEMRLDCGEIIKIPRLCDQCKKFKPRRTHHCSTCKGCIPRMDHHCPVIGTCVHHHNHKGFLLFLFWATVLCGVGVTVMFPPIVSFLRDVSDEPSTIIKELVDLIPVLISITGMTNGFVCGIALAIFQYIQWCYIIKNETQLESGKHKGCDYDLQSALKNAEVVFGPRSYFWFLPIPTTEGDGYTIPIPGEEFTYDTEESDSE